MTRSSNGRTLRRAGEGCRFKSDKGHQVTSLGGGSQETINLASKIDSK